MDNNILDDQFIDKKPNDFKLFWFYLFLGLYMIGVLFKIQHWPFAGLMILLGSAGALAHAVSGLWFYKTKNTFTFYFLVVGIFYLVRLILRSIF